MEQILKYPRTPHLTGSKIQPGDEDLKQLSFRDIADKQLVVEEKLDGSNAAISFSEDRHLRLQSRGHYLTGGPREVQFDLFKSWARCHEAALFDILGTRFVMYGEWLYAKHTIYYDTLPHYFLEFDIYDREQMQFLSTAARSKLLHGLPVRQVPIVAIRVFTSLDELMALINRSAYKSERWRENLRDSARIANVPMDAVNHETDGLDDMEGLYIKIEDETQVTGRAKLVRQSFLTQVVESESHWLDRPLVQNKLRTGIDIFSEALMTFDE